MAKITTSASTRPSEFESRNINAYFCPACTESPLLECEACKGLGVTDCVESGPGSMRIAII